MIWLVSSPSSLLADKISDLYSDGLFAESDARRVSFRVSSITMIVLGLTSEMEQEPPSFRTWLERLRLVVVKGALL